MSQSHHRFEPSGLMPPPAPQVGAFFRFIIVNICLIAGFLGCGDWIANMKENEIKRLGYDPAVRRVEEIINKTYMSEGLPVPYPRWTSMPPMK